MPKAQEGLAVIIPARLASTRLPRKLLADAAGRPILAWTWLRAVTALGRERVHIATDSVEIASSAAAWGASVIATGEHRCGSERVAEAASRLSPPPEWVINLQGDEPLIDPGALVALSQSLTGGPEAIHTCAAPLESRAEWLDPAVVKVVADAGGRALYFSRGPIPFTTAGSGEEGFARVRGAAARHIGIYGYPRALLARFVALPPSPLEALESLEQLRAIEAGLEIRLVRVERAWPAVDTAQDLERVRALLAADPAAGAAPRDEREGRPA